MNHFITAHKSLKRYYFLFIATILILLFFHPAIFSGKTFYFRDIHRWFYPMKFFLAESLKGGSLPYWCSNYYCGSPFMSDLQSGVFYPLSLLFFFFPFPWSLNIFIVLHFFLGFCFFYLFITGIGLTRKSALITAISYCYGSYTIVSINTLNNLTTLIWLPAILWAYQKATQKAYRPGYFLTILFLCMAILGGEPQLFILSTGLLLVYGSLYNTSMNTITRVGMRNILIIFFLITAVFLITILQLEMTYLDYKHSARFGGISYEEASKFSLDTNMLKHFIIPLPFNPSFVADPDPLGNFYPGFRDIPWLLTLYPGLLIVPMALFGLIFNFSFRILLWLMIFVVTLILAMGDTTPAHFLFYKVFPFFRFPVKFIFITSFSLLVISAYGIDRLFALLENKRILTASVLSLTILCMILDLYANHGDVNPFCKTDFYRYHHPSLQPILDDPETFRIYSDPEITIPSNLKKTILSYHVKWQVMVTPNIGMLHDLSYVSGVPALELRYQYFITEILLRPWSEKLHFLKLANVKYIISSEPLDQKPELSGKLERINGLVFRIRDYLPRAWMVGNLTPIRKGTIDELMDGLFDPASSALTQGEILTRYDNPFFKKVDSIGYGQNGTIHIELTADSPSILVLSESSYPGWKVFIDGQEKENLWLNLLFQGVEVDKGKHSIDFIYRPRNIKITALISLVSLGLFVSFWFYYSLSHRRRTRFMVMAKFIRERIYQNR
jgi:hypothetical protein